MNIIKWTSYVVLSALMACSPGQKEVVEASELVQQGEADSKSASLIAELEDAMGGRAAYDDLETVGWTFFGSRKLIWNKKTGDVRIDSPRDSTTYLINVHSGEGRVRIGSNEIMEPDSLQKLVDRGKGTWINDSYWLVMPWKLRDPGVQVSYIGADTTLSGAAADVLQLTFDGVGVTPQNKYHVWITSSDKLLKQWAFYADASDPEPYAVWPWDNYQAVGKGKTLLSYNRSDEKGPSNVKIAGSINPLIYSTWDAADLIQDAFKDM